MVWDFLLNIQKDYCVNLLYDTSAKLQHSVYFGNTDFRFPSGHQRGPKSTLQELMLSPTREVNMNPLWPFTVFVVHCRLPVCGILPSTYQVTLFLSSISVLIRKRAGWHHASAHTHTQTDTTHTDADNQILQCVLHWVKTKLHPTSRSIIYKANHRRESWGALK